MGLLDALTTAIRNTLVGTVLQEPVQSSYPHLRTESMRALFDFIAELTFFRADGVGRPPIAFQVNRRAMYEEWPDAEKEIELPCIAIIPGRGAYESTALAPWMDESTLDTYGEGTAVQALGVDYSEIFNLEIWGATRGERRAVLRGLEIGLSPTEDTFGLKMRVPTHYDEVAYFTPLSSSIIDDPDSARGRRKGRIELQLKVPMTRLVKYNKLDPRIILTVIDPMVEVCPLDIEVIV